MQNWSSEGGGVTPTAGTYITNSLKTGASVERTSGIEWTSEEDWKQLTSTFLILPFETGLEDFLDKERFSNQSRSS